MVNNCFECYCGSHREQVDATKEESRCVLGPLNVEGGAHGLLG